MCGSTSAQDNMQQQQLDEYKKAQQMTEEQYRNQQAIYTPMAKQFQSVFDLGASQEGFSPEEKQNLETQVITGTAGNYANASKAVNEHLAADGGTGAMPSGMANELKLDTALSSAQEKSHEENQLEMADYATGRENWQHAGEGLLTIAAGENPVAYMNASTSAGSAAATTADEIAQEQNSWVNAALGAAGTAIGGWASRTKHG